MAARIVYLIVVVNLLWGFRWGFWPLIPLFASEVGLSSSLYGLVYSVRLGIAAVSGVVGGLLASRGSLAAWFIIVVSYAVARLGVLVMLLFFLGLWASV